MLIKKENSIKKQNSPNCIVREYTFSNKNLWIATTKINWKYPNEWKVVNKKCDLIYFVISWKWIIETDNWVFKIQEWDSFLLEKGKPYKINGEELFVCLSSSPTWYFEQYEEIK